jgi:hypothetical protein
VSRRLLAAALLALGAACAGPGKDRDLTKFASAQLRSILVVPVLNRSVDVTAPDYFLSSVPVPVAERGYYVFPVNLVKRLLEDDGLADAGMVHAADPTRLASIFGADAVLYITIERWDARWVLVNTQVTVAARYVLRDGRTGEELWAGVQTALYNSSGSGGGGGGGAALVQLVADIVAAAVVKAAPNYMPLARQVNGKAVAFPGPGFPAGPYHPFHGQDWAPPAGTAIATPGGAPREPATPTATSTPAATPTSTPAPAPAATPTP